MEAGEFLNLGYELFLDQKTLGARLLQADLFDRESEVIKQLEGKMNIIQIGHFLHLFDLDKQYKACERIVALLKPEKGVLIVGQQIGKVEAGSLLVGEGRMMYKHNPESFENMWKEIGSVTGTEWEVRASLDYGLGIVQTKRLCFEMERIN